MIALRRFQAVCGHLLETPQASQARMWVGAAGIGTYLSPSIQTMQARPRRREFMKPDHLSDTRFDQLDLHEALAANLERLGFEYCTPIQAQTLPLALSGKDVAGQIISFIETYSKRGKTRTRGGG